MNGKKRKKKDTQLVSILKCEVELYEKGMIDTRQDIPLSLDILRFILLPDVQLLQNLD